MTRARRTRGLDRRRAEAAARAAARAARTPAEQIEHLTSRGHGECAEARLLRLDEAIAAHRAAEQVS